MRLQLHGATLNAQAFAQKAYDEAVRKVHRAEAILAEVAQAVRRKDNKQCNDDAGSLDCCKLGRG